MAAITEANGVGCVLSPVISFVINKIENYIEKRYIKNTGIKDEMKKIETTLTEIQFMMNMVEKQKIVDEHHAEMVQMIKDAVYEAEDVFDEYEYDLLEKKSEEYHNRISEVASSYYRVVIGNSIFKRKFNAINENLDRAKVSAQLLLKLLNLTYNIQLKLPENPHVASSHITEIIVGRDREREELIDLLLKNEDESLATIPIVGRGGIGKSTLARIIYNDQRIQEQFETIWIYVSNNFDRARLTRDMLKQASGKSSPVDESFQMLRDKLKKSIASKNKRILLVLDDVWYHRNEDEQYRYKMEWDQVIAPFKNVKRGNRIILTTRLSTVGKILGSIKQEPLNGLNEGNSWSLFKLWAFDDENQGNLLELEPIGKRILDKLTGSALAIKVVGGQLRGNSDVNDWKKVLIDNPLDTSDIISILYRSYEQLPGQLQYCFAYCSLFPKGYRLKPDRLVHMWVAQGFVLPQEKKSLEEVGREYFNKLLAGSFIEMIKQGNKEHCVMHELMNELACHVSKDDCYMLNEGDSMKNLGSIRHLSVSTPTIIDVLRNMNGLDKLRTLIFVKHDRRDIDISEVVIKVARIRVLDMGHYSVENLPNFCDCKHLRYLSFVEPQSNIPPDFFNKLHHLSVLFVRDGTWVKDINSTTIPRSICNLSNLVLIDSDRTLNVNTNRLAKLSLWKGPVFLCVEEYKLDLLGDMNNIKGTLRIWGLENVTGREEAIRAHLSSKELVTRLDLDYAKNALLEVESSKHQEVLEALIPNPNLEILGIRRYESVAWPSWLESDLLSKIKEISLSRISKIETLPALGQLPLLQVLDISDLDDVRSIGTEFYGNCTFPSLEKLSIMSMRRLEKWSHPSDVSVFPKLSILYILYCPMFIVSELDEFPAHEELRIKDCFNGMTISAVLKGPRSLLTITKLLIYGWKGLITLDSLQEMISLKRLSIGDCSHLLSLPKMESFYSLEFLAINKCPQLRSLPKSGLPVSLELLFITETHDYLDKQILHKKGCDWDKIAAISGCNIYASTGKGDRAEILHWIASNFFADNCSKKDAINYRRLREFEINKDLARTCPNSLVNA